MKTYLVSAIALLLSATLAGASSQTLVFGDSLSDVGNERIIDGDAWDLTAYPNGQRTDGVTWAEKIGATFESGYNFAVGAARTLDNGDAYADFAEQRQNFFASTLEAADVSEVAIWFGGNDFRDLLSGGLPTPTDVVTTSGAIIGEILTGIGELALTGLTDFVVFGIPDLSRLPGIVNQPFESLVRDMVEGYDAALQQALAGFASATGLNISFLDIIGLTDQSVANAEALGFTNLTEPCLLNPVACAEDPSQFFYYDGIHPTDAVHKIVAEAFLETVSPSQVPLPAGFPLLASGLVLFGLTSRRYKSRS